MDSKPFECGTSNITLQNLLATEIILATPSVVNLCPYIPRRCLQDLELLNIFISDIVFNFRVESFSLLVYSAFILEVIVQQKRNQQLSSSPLMDVSLCYYARVAV